MTTTEEGVHKDEKTQNWRDFARSIDNYGIDGSSGGTGWSNASVMYTLKRLEVVIEKQRVMHALASAHFKALHDWLLFLPSILLTLGGGIMAFMANSEYSFLNKNDENVILSMSVGITSLVSAFWQSLTKQLDFQGKAVIHQSVATTLKHLLEGLTLKKMDPSITVEEMDAYLDKLQEKFQSTLEGGSSVKSNVPIEISSAFDALGAEINMLLDGQNSKNGINKEGVYLAAWSSLNVLISNYRWWPFKLPASKYSVQMARKEVAEALSNQFKDKQV